MRIKHLVMLSIASIIFAGCTILSYKHPEPQMLGYLEKSPVAKIIFEKLKDSISDPCKTIYVVNFINHIPTIGYKDLEGVIYDSITGKRSFFINTDKREAMKKVIIK